MKTYLETLVGKYSRGWGGTCGSQSDTGKPAHQHHHHYHDRHGDQYGHDQGGRCWGTAVPAVHERSGSSTKGMTPNIRYFVAKLSIVAI